MPQAYQRLSPVLTPDELDAAVLCSGDPRWAELSQSQRLAVGRAVEAALRLATKGSAEPSEEQVSLLEPWMSKESASQILRQVLSHYPARKESACAGESTNGKLSCALCTGTGWTSPWTLCLCARAAVVDSARQGGQHLQGYREAARDYCRAHLHACCKAINQGEKAPAEAKRALSELIGLCWNEPSPKAHAHALVSSMAISMFSDAIEPEGLLPLPKVCGGVMEHSQLGELFDRLQVEQRMVNYAMDVLSVASRRAKAAPCPHPGGWDELLNESVSGGSLLARTLQDGEALTSAQRESILKLSRTLQDICVMMIRDTSSTPHDEH